MFLGGICDEESEQLSNAEADRKSVSLRIHVSQ